MPDYNVARLEPAGPARGRVLLSYKVQALINPDIALSHTQFWETAAMARTWQSLGFQVDVADNDNPSFVPTGEYDFLVASRLQLESLAHQLSPSCVKILHIDTAHWLFSNTATHQRALALQRRRGLTLKSLLEIDRNHAIEAADCATMLGNDFTESTYAFAGKPLYRIPISPLRMFDWPEGKDFGTARSRFVWFGSRGALHKGLDLVLEAFAAMPDLHLTVVGPIAERDFEKVYHAELYRTANIRSIGWVDLAKDTFMDIARESVALVFPSCSEAGAGSVITGMHAGLIPVVTPESSVDVDPRFGVRLPSMSSVEDIQKAARDLSTRPPADLEQMARATWEVVRAKHTRRSFEEGYRRVVSDVIEIFGRAATRNC